MLLDSLLFNKKSLFLSVYCNFFKKNNYIFFNFFKKLPDLRFNSNFIVYLGFSLLNCNLVFFQKRINFLAIIKKKNLIFDGFFFPYLTHQNKTISYFNLNKQFVGKKKKLKNFKKYNVSLLTFFKKQLFFKKKLPNYKQKKLYYIFTRRRKRKLKRLRFKWLRHYKFSSLFSSKVSKKIKFNFKKNNKKQGFSKNWYLIASRFKPGFLTEWRKNREVFNITWDLNYFRQRRLTNFFLSLRGLCGFNFLRLLVLSIGQVCRLSFSNLIDNFNSNFLNKQSFTYKLNGNITINPFIQIFLGDCVQMFKGAFISSRFNTPLSFKKYNMFFKRQNIFKVSFCFKLDSPSFLEIDELTLTSVLILEPDLNQLLYFSEVGPLPFLSFRLYNWKYTL